MRHLARIKRIERTRERIERARQTRAALEALRPRPRPSAKPLPRGDLFARPQGVPKNWQMKPTKDGRGVVFTKPGTKGSTYVKINRAKPESSMPGQRYNNVRWQNDGKSYDVNGNIVRRDSLESHIPVENFKFKPELFK